nr:phage portal protein [Arcanobacterium haemolyticum]
MFRISPHMIGDLEKSSFSNIEQQSLEFVKYTLDPWVIRREQAIIKTLLSADEKPRFCSEEHRRAWWKAYPEAKRCTATYIFTCAGCATTFTAYGNKKRKYCSHVCYVTHRGTA